jgi:hypothetical protein
MTATRKKVYYNLMMPLACEQHCEHGPLGDSESNSAGFTLRTVASRANPKRQRRRKTDATPGA